LKQRFLGRKSSKIVFTERSGTKGLPQESESKKFQGVEEIPKIKLVSSSFPSEGLSETHGQVTVE